MNQEQINKAIDAFGAALEEALDANLGAVLVYGSLVKGDYGAGSDHNVAVLLDHDEAATLRVVAKTMRARRPSRRTGLLLLTSDELERARDVFPLKIRDLARHHRLVVGQDLVSGLQFERKHLVLDAEQQLRSLAIRLRRLFVRGASSPEILRSNLVASFKSFLPPARGLVELLGGPEPKTKQETIAAVTQVLEAPSESLDELSRWAGDPTYTPDVDAVMDGYSKILRGAAAKADALGEG